MPSDVPDRPQWARVIGQEHVKRILLSALQGDRLPHAYLFHGIEGTGKDATALELARVIHCEVGKFEACGTCDSCVQVAALQHPDVRLIVALPVGKGEKNDDPPLAKLSPDDITAIQEQFRLKAADHYHRVLIPRANVIKINSIRELRREAAMTTSDGRRRVMIVSRAEEMGDEASNTILKTLEEPAGHSMLILTSSRPDALLPTIRSRCQQVRFDPLTDEQITQALREREGTPADQAAFAARIAGGSYSRARELLGENLSKERKEVVAFVRLALGHNISALTASIDERAGGKDREKAKRFLRLMLMWFRDALVLSRGGTVINLDQHEDLRRFVANFPGARLAEVIGEVEKAVFLIERNVYIKLIYVNLAVRLKELIA